jgi:hypothetical protein
MSSFQALQLEGILVAIVKLLLLGLMNHHQINSILSYGLLSGIYKGTLIIVCGVAYKVVLWDSVPLENLT